MERAAEIRGLTTHRTKTTKGHNRMAKATTATAEEPKADQIGEWLRRSIDDGKAKIETVSGKRFITYVEVGRTENFEDPEEWVRGDLWAELIYRLGYPAQRISIEVPVPDRVPGDYADLVVCRDDARTAPYIVIETKKDGITRTEFEQAVEQAAGNGSGHRFRADFVATVAGPVRRILDITDGRFGVLERVKNEVADFPANYHDPAKFRFVRTKDATDPAAIKPASKERLIKILTRCHQVLWNGGKRNPPQAFSDLCKVLFVKIADEQKAGKIGDPYEVQIFSGESATDLGNRIRRIYDDHQRTDPDIFTDGLTIPDEQLRVIVEDIAGTNFTASDVDAKGVAFERFMDGFFKGDFGQYFTPREVVQFATKMVDPKFDDWVIDPACGSAGFLLEAMSLVKAKAKADAGEGTEEYHRQWSDFANKRLFGIEINDEIARVAKMNMILHGDGRSHVFASDSLIPAADLHSMDRLLRLNTFDVLLTNVPFGATISKDQHAYLPGYIELGNTHSTSKKTGAVKHKPRATQKSEILFLERIWQLLRPDGRCAVIVPDGILTNAQTSYVRQFLLDRFRVWAVVSLPVEAFMHFRASVKASILFMTKLAEGETYDNDAPVFLAEAASVGYDATGHAAPNDLDEILAAWRAFRDAEAKELVTVPDLLVRTAKVAGDGE